MDVPIKIEADILEDTISESCEFLDEKPDEKNIATIPVTIIDKSIPVLKKQARKRKSKKKETRKRYNRANEKRKQTGKVTEKDEFTLYLRKKFLQIFHNEGWSPQIVAKYVNAYNIKLEDVNGFFNQAAKDAQQYVYQECDSLSFSHITEWLKYFQEMDISKMCNYEPAIVLNAIVNNEYHPGQEDMEGINLKEIYKFLSNALMGLPQKPLDETSAKFLSNEFKNLINAANTDEADNDVRNMKKTIESSLKNKQKFYNLDPLNTDVKQLESWYMRYFNHNNLKFENIG